MGREVTGWALDLDGVIWRGTKTVPGAPEAVAALRAAGVPIAFVTNSALRTPGQVAANLAHHGIPDATPEVITAAMAVATLIEPGERVLAIGSDGLIAALKERGATVVTNGPADAVVVGITVVFDYDAITRAMRAVDGGARLIATNTDSTFPSEDGLLPGNGALVASIETATGQQATIAGKPHEPTAALVRDLLGPEGIMVGDRPETDGLFAQTIGYDFGLVLSGITQADDLPVEPAPIAVADDLLALATERLGN